MRTFHLFKGIFILCNTFALLNFIITFNYIGDQAIHFTTKTPFILVLFHLKNILFCMCINSMRIIKIGFDTSGISLRQTYRVKQAIWRPNLLGEKYKGMFKEQDQSIREDWHTIKNITVWTGPAGSESI